ncbi:unnamed protein product, partial [Durusdinium trenchii]
MDEPAQKQFVADNMDSDLQFVLADSGVGAGTSSGDRTPLWELAEVYAPYVTPGLRFEGLDTPEGRAQSASVVSSWEVAQEYIAKEVEIRAEAKVLGQPRALQVHERQAMLKAVEQVYGILQEAESPSADYLSVKAEETESNEPIAAPLDEVTSKKDSTTSGMQYRAKAWLHGLTPDPFNRFVDFILGDRVYNIQVPSLQGEGVQKVKPDWTIILAYEHKLRKEAFKLVIREGYTLAEALGSVIKDADLKETYFTTPVALRAAMSVERHPPNKFQRSSYKGFGDFKGDWKGKGKSWKGGKGDKGGKGSKGEVKVMYLFAGKKRQAGNSKGEGKDLGTTEGGPPCPNFSMVNQTQKPIVDLTSGEPVREPSVESIRPLTQADEVEAFDMVSCLNSGHPIRVEWDTFERDFIDGFGLWSPTRWPPAARGVRRSVAMKRLAFETFSLLADTVRQCIPDVRSAAFALVTGKFQASPFVGEPLESLRTQWAGLLRDPADALVIDSGQPFLLRGMAQWLTVFEDPDVGWLVDAEDCFATGVPLGVDAPLPRSPQVFPEKVKHRKLVDSDFNPVASNYPSAQLSTAELESKFREEELAGRMYPTRYSVLKEEFGEERIRIASMAAITKPDGSIRPLHDGTHSVQVNNRIVYRDQIQCPGPPEVASVVRESVETRE